MSDLINNNQVINNTSSAPKTTGPREDQTTQASASSQAQETQSAQASSIYNTSSVSAPNYFTTNYNFRTTESKNQHANSTWTTNTSAVLAA
jgi:hypothetical protein